MKEKEYVIMGSRRHNDLLKMRPLEVLSFEQFQKNGNECFIKWNNKYRYCYILETFNLSIDNGESK